MKRTERRVLTRAKQDPQIARLTTRALQSDIHVCTRPYLVHVKCRFHIRFHIGLNIQGSMITDGKSARYVSGYEDFLQDHALSQHAADILLRNFAV